MKESLLELSNSAIVQNILKKAGITPPPVLARASSPWRERFLQDSDIIIGGSGSFQTALAENLVGMGASLILGPAVDESKYTEIDHYKIQSLDNSNMIAKAKSVVFDASDLLKTEDLRKIYEFFHGVTQYLSANSRVVILTAVPGDILDITHRTTCQSIVGFGKSLAKELGNKGTTVQVIQLPNQEEGLRRAAPVLQFFLSDYSAFITGQVIRITTIARASGASTLAGSLAGKAVLVTGATGGIGVATVTALAEEGAHVLCLDHENNTDRLHDLAKKVDGTAIPMSLGNSSDAEKLEQEIKQAAGYVDVLVHNAGITKDRTVKKMPEVYWDQVMAVNLSAITNVTGHFARTGLLKDFGRVICLSSISGLAGNFGQTNYAAAKAGLIGYVGGLSRELAPRGITANAVAPGFIETPMTEKVPFFTRQFARRLATLSQGGLPQDIANAICFLSSEASQGINGSVLRVCGGHIMGA